MNKAPSFQFYPGDWLRNEVSGCSLEAQGLWLRMMVIMHDAQIYGQLVLNNEPMSSEFIAKKIGISPKKYSNLLQELELAEVINRKENGVIFSGRMERDEAARQQNRDRQAKHREVDNGESNADVTVEVTPMSHKSNADVTRPSSSSSSLSSILNPTNGNGFAQFDEDQAVPLIPENRELLLAEWFDAIAPSTGAKTRFGMTQKAEWKSVCFIAIADGFKPKDLAAVVQKIFNDPKFERKFFKPEQALDEMRLSKNGKKPVDPKSDNDFKSFPLPYIPKAKNYVED